MERMSVVKSIIWKNGDDYFRLENTGFRKWHYNYLYLGTQCLPMPASCSMILNRSEGCGENESRE